MGDTHGRKKKGSIFPAQWSIKSGSVALHIGVAGIARRAAVRDQSKDLGIVSAANHIYASQSRASSEESDIEFNRCRRRHRSPLLPKLPTFDGKPGEWKSFICQFRQRAKSCGWRTQEKLNWLTACLRVKAVDYVFNRPKDLRSDYYTFKDMLSQRYNIAELHGTARRRGCRYRAAAYAASEHKPETIYKALQNVKGAAANLQVFG